MQVSLHPTHPPALAATSLPSSLSPPSGWLQRPSWKSVTPDRYRWLFNCSFSGNCTPNPLASFPSNGASLHVWTESCLLDGGEPRAALCIAGARPPAARPERRGVRALMWALVCLPTPHRAQPWWEHRCGQAPEFRTSGHGVVGKVALSAQDISAHPLPRCSLGPDWLAHTHMQLQCPMDGRSSRWRAPLTLPGAATWCQAGRHKDS